MEEISKQFYLNGCMQSRLKQTEVYSKFMTSLKSIFDNNLKDGFELKQKYAYSEDLTKASDEGIFSGILKAGVFDSEALKRLIRSYGSGVAKPRYTNVARGGIISLLGA